MNFQNPFLRFSIGFVALLTTKNIKLIVITPKRIEIKEISFNNDEILLIVSFKENVDP